MWWPALCGGASGREGRGRETGGSDGGSEDLLALASCQEVDGASGGTAVDTWVRISSGGGGEDMIVE